MMADDVFWMQRALQLAQQAYDHGEVPVGAVVVLDGECIGEGYNQPIGLHNPIAHAEMMALQAAGKTMQNYRLPNADLYVSLEPCAMCAAAMVHARIRRLVFATTEPKAGCVVSQQKFFEEPFLNHRVAVSHGVLAEQATHLLQTFFRKRRLEKRGEKS